MTRYDFLMDIKQSVDVINSIGSKLFIWNILRKLFFFNYLAEHGLFNEYYKYVCDNHYRITGKQYMYSISTFPRYTTSEIVFIDNFKDFLRWDKILRAEEKKWENFCEKKRIKPKSTYYRFYDNARGIY